MKKPMRKVKKFNEGGSSYTGDDEIVKYRMGQIKDPGVDLFKLARGEEQVAKPVPLDKKAESEPAKPAPAKAEVKTEVKTTSEDIVDETGTKSKFKRNQETGDLYTPIENIEKPAAKPAKKTSSSTSSAKPAEKPAAKTETKAEAKTEPKKSYDSNAANAAIKAQAKLDSEYTPPKPPPSPGRLGFKGDFFSGRPYGAEKYEKLERMKRGLEGEGAFKKGGMTKMAGGGKVKSASARADGCAIRGKTRA